jgi:hypothetical protein
LDHADKINEYVLGVVGSSSEEQIFNAAGDALGGLITAEVPGAVTKTFRPTGTTHVANVAIIENGQVINKLRIRSGAQTAMERSLGFPQGSLASHTEARAMQHIAPTLKSGQTMRITGTRRPCNSCKGKMNRGGAQSGSVRYQWRQDGVTRRWP